uniref:Ig-like domain-containing protein n=1 Tax=Esox lucius TaxID=8010 RepID=A0A3P8YII6_ESOLU
SPLLNTFSDVAYKYLTQKPSVLIPALTEGETISMTCIAPGFCSGRPPKNLTSVNTTHLSTLTFTPSAEHNGINVTCQVTFNEKIKTEETVTLNVTSETPGSFEKDSTGNNGTAASLF